MIPPGLWPTPYYVCIFSSELSESDSESYKRAALEMEKRVQDQEGFLGMESYRSDDGRGTTLSYWKSLEDLKKWREDRHHQEVQSKGRDIWYKNYTIRVGEVQRDDTFAQSKLTERAFAGERLTSRLRLREWSQIPAADLLAYYQRNEAHLQPTSPARPKNYYSLQYWEGAVEKARIDRLQDRALRWAFYLKEQPTKIVGLASFTQIFRGAFKAAYLGFSVDAAHEKQGLMKEGLESLLTFAFEDLKLNRVMANHLPENKRSAKLLEKLGFEVEGHAKKYLCINGVWRDHVLTALVNPGTQEVKK